MRELQSEHISMLAVMLIGDGRSGMSIETAVEKAISVQLESRKQCDHLNDLAERLRNGMNP